MTAPAASPASRPRPARRALDDLGLTIDSASVSSAAAAAGEPAWLQADRAEAAEAYAALPAESNLLYSTYIDLRAAQLGDARLVSGPAATGETSLPDDADAIIVIDEGERVAIALSPSATAAGVRVTEGVTEADRAALLETSLPKNDKFAQLTRAAWSRLVVIDVPDGLALDKPIIVRWALGAADRALLTRTIVRLGAGARAAVVEELVASSAAVTESRQAFFAGTTEVALGAGATLHVASLQELPTNVIAIQHRVAEIGEDATLHWALAQLGGRLVRARSDNRLVGDRSSVEQVEILFGSEDQLFDLTSYTTHVGRDTTGDLLSKGALLDRARTYLKGLIIIEKTAIGTDSFLGEFGMNLSKQARSVAIPSLEIDQPDCRRAMHSSSVGPIDETQLFYLESRGIPPDEARKFIVLGFLEPVVARVPLASAQQRLRDLLEAKWAAGFAGDTEAAA